MVPFTILHYLLSWFYTHIFFSCTDGKFVFIFHNPFPVLSNAASFTLGVITHIITSSPHEVWGIGCEWIVLVVLCCFVPLSFSAVFCINSGIWIHPRFFLLLQWSQQRSPRASFFYIHQTQVVLLFYEIPKELLYTKNPEILRSIWGLLFAFCPVLLCVFRPSSAEIYCMLDFQENTELIFSVCNFPLTNNTERLGVRFADDVCTGSPVSGAISICTSVLPCAHAIPKITGKFYCRCMVKYIFFGRLISPLFFSLVFNDQRWPYSIGFWGLVKNIFEHDFSKHWQFHLSVLTLTFCSNFTI